MDIRTKRNIHVYLNIHFMPFNIFCVNNLINNMYVILICDQQYTIWNLVCWLYTTMCLCIVFNIHLLFSNFLLREYNLIASITEWLHAKEIRYNAPFISQFKILWRCGILRNCRLFSPRVTVHSVRLILNRNAQPPVGWTMCSSWWSQYGSNVNVQYC